MLIDYMDQRFYPTFQKNWDDELFREEVLRHIKPEHTCLDYGAGRGNVTQMNFKGHAKWLVGVDPDQAVLGNPHLDEAKVLDLETQAIPYPDETFDVIFSDNVMEHIHDPETTLRELHRVLKRGGVLLAKTPNKWHYMPIIARSTPVAFHRFYNRLRGREEQDTFPTLYKLNSRRDVRMYAEKVGLRVDDIQTIEGRPEYLRLTPVTYAVGMAYERIVNKTSILSGLRCVLMFKLSKP